MKTRNLAHALLVSWLFMGAPAALPPGDINPLPSSHEAAGDAPRQQKQEKSDDVKTALPFNIKPSSVPPAPRQDAPAKPKVYDPTDF